MGNFSVFGVSHDFETITLYLSLYDRRLVKHSSSLGNLSRKQRHFKTEKRTIGISCSMTICMKLKLGSPTMRSSGMASHSYHFLMTICKIPDLGNTKPCRSSMKHPIRPRHMIYSRNFLFFTGPDLMGKTSNTFKWDIDLRICFKQWVWYGMRAFSRNWMNPSQYFLFFHPPFFFGMGITTKSEMGSLVDSEFWLGFY